jgi:molecular chaperone DnaJ
VSKRDYYEILGVAKDADENAIKRAYRKLAMKYHPDRNPDDKAASENFREVTEAYEVLTDDNKRARYNQYGHAGVDEQMQDFWGRGGAQDSHAFRDFGDMFGDVFGDMFGFGGGGGRTARGADLRYNLNLTLEEAARGREIELKIPRHESCGTCNGSGARPGSNPVPCSTCGGHGQVQMQQGFFAVRRTCPTCHGAGTRIESPCVDCGGNGRIKVTKKLKVRVPVGVYDGAQVRVSGEGEIGQKGSVPGDLYIVITLKKHSIFERDGADLYCTMPVTFPQAALGAQVDAPTLDGKVTIKIPAGTEAGRTFRLRGHGVPDVRAGSQKGDLYVRVQIAVPKKMSGKQEDLLRQFAEETGDELYPERSSFLGKVKDLWDDLSQEGK